MTPRWETHITKVITKEDIGKAEQCLADNGIEPDEASTVLQAVGYILLGEELYKQEKDEQEYSCSDIWDSHNDNYVEIDIGNERFVCVKFPQSAQPYIMANADGTQVYNKDGQTFPDIINEKQLVAFAGNVLAGN